MARRDEDEDEEVVATEGPLLHLGRLADYQDTIDLLIGLGERSIAKLVVGRLRVEAEKLEDCLESL